MFVIDLDKNIYFRIRFNLGTGWLWYKGEGFRERFNID